MIAISIIVTSYNQADTLPQTLDSILAQHIGWLAEPHAKVKFEIIIGNDCSTDNTREVCEKYRKNHPDIIRPLHHATNGGVATNFVQSVKEARGKYIALCAADDYWHNPQKLQMQVDYMEANPDCGFLYTDYDKLHVGTGKITASHLANSQTTIYEGKNLIKTVFGGSFPALTLTVLFRKELFDKYIPIDDYIKLRFTLEDWPTWVIFSKHTRIGYLPVSTGTYRYGHESISNPRSYEKTIDRFVREKRMYKYLCDMFPNDLDYDERGYDLYVNGVLLSLAYKRNDAKKANEFAAKMLELGDKSWRTRFSANWLGFWMFGLLKRVARRASR